MRIQWSKKQTQELDWARRHHPVAHVRVKSLALWDIGQGHGLGAAADGVGVTRQSVRFWIRRFSAAGVAGLHVRPGRGRPSCVDPEEVLRVLEQSPRAFGLAQERWTLAALRRAVSSLRHLRSLRSVGYVMARLGLAPKRGQYRRQSPDPEYTKKKPVRSGASSKPANGRRR
mgnify:FL=1